MSKVVRVFSFTGWRLAKDGPGGTLEAREDLYQIACHALGHYLDQMGHQAALNKLRDKVGVYIQQNLARKLFLADDHLELLTYATEKHGALRRYLLPGGCEHAHLADHLLLQVCEPLLRDQGLLVTQIDVQCGADPRAGSMLPPDVTAQYLAAAQGITLAEALARSSAEGFTSGGPPGIGKLQEHPNEPAARHTF